MLPYCSIVGMRDLSTRSNMYAHGYTKLVNNVAGFSFDLPPGMALLLSCLASAARYWFIYQAEES